MKKIIFCALFATLLLSGNAEGVFQETEKNLALEWVNFTKDGVATSVRNEGERIEKEEKADILFEWIRCETREECEPLGSPYAWNIERDLEKGETLIISSNNSKDLKSWTERQPLGVERVRITIDSRGAFAESNESDNVWEERPIGPRTTGRALAARDAEAAAGLGGSVPKMLPGSGFYVFKNMWREARIFFSFKKEKRIEKRLDRADERLREARELARNKTYGEMARTIENTERDFRKAKRAAGRASSREEKEEALRMAAEEIGRRIRAQIALDDIEMEAPPEKAREIGEARKAMVVGIARRIFDAQANPLALGAIQSEVKRRNTGPFYALRGLNLLRSIQKYYPGKESEGIKNVERELMRELGDRMTYMPEDIRGEVAAYIVNISNNEESALQLLQRIELLEKEENKREVVRLALTRAGQELRGELVERIQEKKAEEKKAVKKAAEKGDEEKTVVSPRNAEKEEEALAEQGTGQYPAEEAVCSEGLRPVCGKDDVTYRDACEAGKKGIEVAHKEACDLSDPDLVVEKAEILPFEPKEGDWISARASILNNGGTVQKIFRNRLRVDADINGIYDMIPSEYPLNLVRTSSSAAIAWERVWQAVEGVHRAEICADSGKHIAESNEGNNCTLLAFPVGPA
ncbi:MAG: DUF5667 domain-containing protein, partial [Nanoarchaeota archaeon]|nr:DUF5667 domain-containing protein [Nanoarchaeota archaeon]